MNLQLKRDVMECSAAQQAPLQHTYLEAEAVLPGGLRDEVRVFYTSAQAVPLTAEAAGSRLTVSGRAVFRALYAQGDLTRVRCAEAVSDFSKMLPITAQDAPVQYQPLCEVTAVSARVFNGRLLMRADMAISAEGVQSSDTQVITDVEAAGAQLLTESCTLQRTVGGGDAQGLIRGEAELSQALQAEETLFADAQARVEDIIGGADGRATVTGTIDLTACHASRMPGRPLVCTQHSIPFEQSVTLSGEMGDLLSASAVATDAAVALEGSGEKQMLRAEVGLQVQVQSLREEQRTRVVDVFGSGDMQLLPEGQRIAWKSAVINEQTAESGRMQMILPESAPRIKTVLAAFLQPVLIGAEAQSGRLHVDMLLRATLVYMTEDSGIPVSHTAEEPARMAFATQADAQDALRLFPTRVEASAVAGDRAEIRYVMSLSASGSRYAQGYAVTDVAGEETADMQSVLALYRTQAGERLWDVMKRYRMPAEQLRALNENLPQEAGEELTAGTHLIAYRR